MEVTANPPGEGQEGPDGPYGLDGLDGVVVGADDPALAGLVVAGAGPAELAARTLERSGIRVTTPARLAAEGGTRPVVVHDAHCPLAGAAALGAVAAAALGGQVAAVGVRPVTDTVKRVRADAHGEWLGETVDRDGLVQVAAPLVLPDASLLALAPATSDLAVLVAWLRTRQEVRLVTVDALARRIGDASDLALLEALRLGLEDDGDRPPG